MHVQEVCEGLIKGWGEGRGERGGRRGEELMREEDPNIT